MAKYLCMPADFDKRTLEVYAEIAREYPDFVVAETYGNLNPTTYGSGRDSPVLPRVSLPELEQYVKCSRDLGIDFNYTFNAACLGGLEFSSRGAKRLIEFITQLWEIGIRTFTVTIPSLVPLVKNRLPHATLCSSLICEVDSVSAARVFAAHGYDRVIIDDTIIRRFDIIRAMRKHVSVPLETLVNNTCLFNCPWKVAHYNLLAHAATCPERDLELYYHWQCMKVRCTEPAELLRLRWIRPEDIRHYDDITYFKVVGRYFVRQSNLERAARAYASQRFEGNLWELLGNFAPQRRHGFHIENRELDGFIEWFVKDATRCHDAACVSCAHCQRFARKAIDPDRFHKVAHTLGLSHLHQRIDRFHRYGQPLGLDEAATLIHTIEVSP